MSYESLSVLNEKFGNQSLPVVGNHELHHCSTCQRLERQCRNLIMDNVTVLKIEMKAVLLFCLNETYLASLIAVFSFDTTSFALCSKAYNVISRYGMVAAPKMNLFFTAPTWNEFCEKLEELQCFCSVQNIKKLQAKEQTQM